MKNLYKEINNFFDSYILKNEITLYLENNLFSKVKGIHYFLDTEDKTYFSFKKQGINKLLVNRTFIKHEKSNFIQDFFNIEENHVKQFKSIKSLTINLFADEKNNIYFTDREYIKLDFINENEIELSDTKTTLSFILREDHFTIENKIFKYADYDDFPVNEVISHLKDCLIKKTKESGLNIDNLNLKSINNFQKMSGVDFLNVVNKVDNFKIKSFSETIKNLNIKELRGGKNYLISKDDLKYIKKTFKEILDPINYSYFCQSIDLFCFFYYELNKKNEYKIYFSIFEKKYPTPYACYSFYFDHNIILNIGINCSSESKCNLISYSFKNNFQLNKNINYNGLINYVIDFIDSYNEIPPEIDINYSNFMKDFYINLLNELKSRITKLINKETIKSEDIQLLKILFH